MNEIERAARALVKGGPGFVTDQLRDQIAEVLLADWPAPVFSAGKQLAQAQKLADKVIAALGLRQEWGALAPDDSGFLYDRREEVKPWKDETVKTRYITEWTEE